MLAGPNSPAPKRESTWLCGKILKNGVPVVITLRKSGRVVSCACGGLSGGRRFFYLRNITASFSEFTRIPQTTRHLEPVASSTFLKYSVSKAPNYCWEDPNQRFGEYLLLEGPQSRCAVVLVWCCWSSPYCHSQTGLRGAVPRSLGRHQEWDSSLHNRQRQGHGELMPCRGTSRPPLRSTI